MEILGLLIVLVGVLFAISRSNKSNQRGQQRLSREAPKLTTKQTHPVHRTTTSSAQSRHRQPPPFSEKGARHLKEERVLKGSAWVVDGDTIKIKNTQIRLFGVDAPELNHPYGKKAKWALHNLCKGQEVTAEITEVDDYGRTVARCHLPDGTDLSAEMVRLGLALDWAKFSEGAYCHLETADARKKLFLADARQKGRMHIWERFESKKQKS